MARVPEIPPAAPGDSSPWQCLAPSSKPAVTTRWQRDSLEYCRLAVGIYDNALAAVRRIARSNRRGSWIVIMDADETVLDNSLFERERDACGGKVEDAQWESWVAARLAPDVPGAAAFTNAVHRLGGYVAIVTNRLAKDDAVTQDTLRKAGIWFDYEIGAPDSGHTDKTARWQGVKAALAARFGGRPRAVMWVGDQITDFPILDADGRIVRAMNQHDDGKGVGERFFLLPNPMYGNWQGNPAN
ncbi:MAG TPA: HAD family acid phosphatase [Rhizomicrobium sp.]|nr:HAD family acid phosphatase [Rhizomicrobium sp.]